MKLLGKIYRFFFWQNLYKVSDQWDQIVLDRMGKYEFEIIDKYTVKLGDLSLWIGNYPYAYLHDCNIKNDDYCFIPKKETRYKAKKRIDLVFKKYLKETYPISE